MPSHRLFFIRHGETDWNAERRLQGHQDIPLNERGIWQAGESGRRVLKMLGPKGIADGKLKFVASPLDRTVNTMRLARTAMGLSQDGYELEPRLKELTFGEWEGLTWPEVQARSPHAANWREGDKWNFVPPGGESYEMLTARLKPWLDEVDRDLVVVSHGGVARALMAMIGGLAPERAALADVWQGRVLVFHRDRFDWD
jgi:broad specificity phosphatase PhoE